MSAPKAEDRSSASPSERRERFRSRPLTGTGSGQSADSPAASYAAELARSRRHPESGVGRALEAGKLSLERVTAGHDADDAEVLDVLVDEEHGVIGESDSGPEER